VQQDNFRKPLEHQTSTPVVDVRLDFHKHYLVEHIVCLVSQEHFPLVQALNNARNVLLATKGHPTTTQKHALNVLLVGIKIPKGKLRA
jgi:hypothetical protein